jgi:ATP-dependent DNA helicase RecG
MTTVRAATEEYEKLSEKVFSDLKLGLLHGKMKGKDKDEVIEEFRKGKLDVLVSTPVVEVGVDIPAASIMLIEAADRFGLAQLHQLRGRVGRAGQQAYCLLFAESGSKKAYGRLKSLERCYSGMELAEIDLKYRGPGQIYGTAQHGFWDTKVADLSDVELVKQTKECAEEAFENLDKYPVLKKRLKKRTMAAVGPN